MNFYPFSKGVANFKFIFLCHFSINFERFGAYPAAFMQNFPKHTNFFPFWWISAELWPLFLRSHFFLVHPVSIVYFYLPYLSRRYYTISRSNLYFCNMCMNLIWFELIHDIGNLSVRGNVPPCLSIVHTTYMCWTIRYGHEPNWRISSIYQPVRGCPYIT